MAKVCDNKSVGQIIKKDRDIVLIERHNYPQAIALPAGHLDGDAFEDAAKKESLEEVGATIIDNKLVWRGRVDNPCKREGGSYHLWEVYEATAWEGELRAGDDAKTFFWGTPEKLLSLAKRTEYFINKYKISYANVGGLTKAIFGDPAEKNTDPEWLSEMGLEPVWYFILKELSVI